MKQVMETLHFSTRGRGLLDITGKVSARVTASGIASGLLTLFVRHTSASLLAQENAGPVVLHPLGDQAYSGRPLRKYRLFRSGPGVPKMPSQRS